MHFFCKDLYQKVKVLTYFQVDVRVQFLQLVRHTISLDASQLE